MVLGAIAAAAGGVAATGASNWDMGGMLAGLGTSGRGAKVDQKFQRLFFNIDYKIQRQELHRDDIRDLMDLTVSRMDVYNVVGALIATYSLEWVTDNSVVSAERESWKFPKWFATVFIVHCFSAAGFLLFSLWFSLHCSIVSKAQGTKMLLHFARLTIPIREEIEKLRVKFYGRPGLGRMAERLVSPPPHAPVPEEEQSSESDDGTAVPSHHSPVRKGRGSLDDADYHNDSDADFQRHLRLWVEERGKWLSYDAYSRVCMTVGMNQLLQAMCYNLIASLWDVSWTSTLVCVLVAKVLSLHILQIDVELSSIAEISVWGVCVFLPPLLTMPLLAIMPPRNALKSAERARSYGLTGLWAIPIFLLQGVWMLHLSGSLRERSIKDVAASDAESDSDCESRSATSMASSRYTTLKAGGNADGLEHLPTALIGPRLVRKNAKSLYQVFRLDRPWRPPAGEWFDHTPARIVRSFTLVLSLAWVLAGLLHAGEEMHVAFSIEQDDVGEAVAHTWPAPAGLFEVHALHCGAESEVLVQGRYKAFRTTLANGSLAELRTAECGVAAMVCGQQGCDVLQKGGGIVAREQACSDFGAVFALDIPAGWKLLTGAWKSGDVALLAGFDGEGVAVAEVAKGKVEPVFRVRPGMGGCKAPEAQCKAVRECKYSNVVALQLVDGGRALFVLHRSGALDAWQLGEGALLGRWQLEGEGGFTAMCSTGKELLCSGAGRDGPSLVRWKLREALRQAYEEGGSQEPARLKR